MLIQNTFNVVCLTSRIIAKLYDLFRLACHRFRESSCACDTGIPQMFEMFLSAFFGTIQGNRCGKQPTMMYQGIKNTVSITFL